jgi:hypothetical protein
MTGLSCRPKFSICCPSLPSSPLLPLGVLWTAACCWSSSGMCLLSSLVPAYPLQSRSHRSLAHSLSLLLVSRFALQEPGERILVWYTFTCVLLWDILSTLLASFPGRRTWKHPCPEYTDIPAAAPPAAARKTPLLLTHSDIQDHMLLLTV